MDGANPSAAEKLNQEQFQRVVRTGFEPGNFGSQGQRPNHWAAALLPLDTTQGVLLVSRIH